MVGLSKFLSGEGSLKMEALEKIFDIAGIRITTKQEYADNEAMLGFSHGGCCYEACTLVLCHPARLCRVLLVHLPPKSSTTTGRMDTTGEGDGRRTNEISWDR